MKRKILSLILVFAMTVSLLTVGTGAVEPTYGDTAGHWAESSIERWSAYGIIQGSNGLFDPNGQLTCAQLATILAKLLKLPAAKDAGFTDNTADAWYYDAINRCAAAGILNGNGDGTVTPEAPISRERAMVMLARALGIEPIRKPDLTKYTDAAQVSAYAQGYVAALIEAGIVGGVTADELAPQDNINRASTVTILDRAIGTYADKAGATVKADGKGLVLVVAENVKITGAPEGTKIVVADGATGLTVNGKSVSDDQTYIVPKTEPAKPSSGSSGGYSHSHTIADEWSYDDTYHWHEASCGREAHRSSKGEHTYNGGNVCTVCGQVNPTVTVAKIGDKNYATLADAMTYAVNNDTIVLVKPENITSAVFTENKSVTLDLNGQTLAANVESNKAAIQVDGSNAALTIKDSSGSGKISSTGYGVYALNGASVTVESGSIESYVSPLSGNNTTGNMNFTVKGGTLTAQKGPAIYMPGQVNLVITGGTLNGGISLRMGQVNISGGTINATENDIDSPAGFYSFSGNAWLPDALYVFGGTYTSDDATYGNSLNLNITGGTFNCANGQGSAVAIYDLGKVAQTMDVKISGDAALTTNATGRGAYQVLSLSDIGVTSPAEDYGNTEYTGKVSSAITGGTFSSDPSKYVAEGYIARENNGKYVVSMVGTAENPYTLDEFNALTKLPAGRDKLYVDLGNASLQNGLTIGNDKIADHYYYGEPNSTTAPEGFPHDTGRTDNDNRHIYSTGKDTVTVVVTGSVTGASDTGDFNAGAITLKVPDAANVIFDTVTFGEGQMAMSMWTESHVQSMTVSHRLASVTFNGCTFKGNWLQNGAFGADEMTITGCTFEKHENTAGINSDGFNCMNNSNPIWIQNMGQTNVTIEGCTINAVRPIKLWEGGANGSVTIRGNTFNMEKCSIDDDNTHKNIAIMFCGTTEQVKLGNVEISGNTVTGDATSLICFYNGRNAGENHYPAMNEGATFSLYNNILPEGTALSVIWKTATVWAPTYVPIPQ